jgi:hypothetical protein
MHSSSTLISKVIILTSLFEIHTCIYIQKPKNGYEYSQLTRCYFAGGRKTNIIVLTISLDRLIGVELPQIFVSALLAVCRGKS